MTKQILLDDIMIKKPWKNKIIPKKEPKKKLKKQTVLQEHSVKKKPRECT
jgi:hypothetical protein